MPAMLYPAGGNFTLDGANGQTAEVSLLDISVTAGSVTIPSRWLWNSKRWRS